MDKERQIRGVYDGTKEEDVNLLIKDISTALVENHPQPNIPLDVAEEMLQNALKTRAKILSGEMKTWTLKEAKARFNAGT